jgi:predicted aconitase with swiveling domain
MLEKNLGKNLRVILDTSYGFEGNLTAVTRNPAGIWLSEAEAIILRATIAQPIPIVTGREERSEIFIHLNSVQRIEVLHAIPREETT